MVNFANYLIKYPLLWVLLLWTAEPLALSFDNLPFISKKPGFQIQLATDKALRELLKEELAQQRKSNRQLQQYTKPGKIAHFESRLLTERLRAEGYYASEVRTSIKDDDFIYQINPGPVYRIEQLTVDIPKHIAFPMPDLAGVDVGLPLRADTVLAAKKSLTQAIASNSCLYQVEVQYQVKVFHESRTAKLVYLIKNSPVVHFGDISFTGLNSVSPDYLRKLTGISRGECFQRSKLDRAQLILMQTNLLARVDVEVSAPENGLAAVNFRVSERHHRTTSTGIGFQSDEGFGVSAGWEHRNWLGEAQKLSLKAHLAQNLQSLSSSLTFPNFRRDNQSITFYTDLERENTDAYESKAATAGVEISRQLRPHLLGMMGTEVEFSEITEDGLSETYALLSLPLSIEFDKRNDPLNPRSGWVTAARVRPYWDAYNTSTMFFKTTLAGSGYFTLEDWLWQPTFATRAAIGSIQGAKRDQVPANVRYYVGGGGSVRGYPYQSLGPLTGNEPDGGLSFNEASFEVRLHWGQNWGGVVFLDGGFAYEESNPRIGQDLLWGAGLGIRYFTSFAPIRFDIAMPLNRRPELDDSFHVYISIGQAF